MLKTSIRHLIGLRNETDFYSQGGEDAIVWQIAAYVSHISKGFYVDVGAYDPFRHSNTHLLYKAGWRGMNIEPRPGSKALFDRARPEDINIECGVSDSDGVMTYHVLDGQTMNSFAPKQVKRYGLEVRKELSIPVYRLDTLLERHSIKSIDYLNVDTEGFEMEILRGLSIDPKIISIEQNGILSLKDVFETEVYEHLSNRGYEAVAKNVIIEDAATVFYIQNTFS